MKKLLLLFTLFLPSVVTVAQMSGTYNVDPTQSASSSNYQSIVSAVFDLTQASGTRPDGGPRNGPGVSGNVTISIANGTYRGQLKIGPISGTSSTQKVTFESASGIASQVIIQDTATSLTDIGTVRIVGADYVNFNKLSIRTLGSSFATAIWIDSGGTDLSSHIRFENCRITARWSVTNKTYCGAYIFGNQSNIAFVRDTFDNASCGIYFDGSRNGGNLTENLTIDSCSFIRMSSSDVFQPFYIRYVKGLSMVGNYTTKNGCCADRIGQIFVLRPPANISLNRFYYTSSAGRGVDLDSVNMFNDGDDVYIFNNFMQSNYASTGNMLRIYRSAKIQVVHNNFLATGSSTDFSIIETDSRDSVRHHSVQIYNNYFASNGAQMLNILGTNSSVARKYLSRLNFNNYARLTSSTQVLFSVSGTKYSSASAIPNLIYNGSDSASFFENVGFKSSADLHLTQNPCLIGTPVSWVPKDIDGETRQSSPVIGADEAYPNRKGNNLGVIAITSPGTTFTPGTQDIKILIKNYGSNTVTSFNAKYQVNGGTLYTSFQNVSLAPCDTMSVTFTGSLQYNFPSGPSFLKVYIDSVNGTADSVRTNDTLTRAFCSPLSGTYTIKPTSAIGGTNFQSFTQLADALGGCGINGAVTVLVDSALYQEHVIFGPISGNSTTNSVTIEGVSGKPVISRLAYNGGTPHLFRVDGPVDLTFRNLAFRSDSANQGIMIQAITGKTLRIKKCSFEYTGNAANSTSSNLQSILVSSSYTNTGAQATFDLVEVDSNTFTAGYYALYAYCQSYTNQLKSRFNRIENMAGPAYYLYTPTVDISNNYISQRNSGSGNAIYLFNSNPNAAGLVNRINSNTIPQFGSSGISVQSSRGSTTSGMGEIYNNMIGGNALSSGTTYGIYLSSSDRWKIFHNSINISTYNASNIKGIAINGGSSSVYANQIKNNSIALSSAYHNNPMCVEIQYYRLVDTTGGVNFNNYFNASNSDIISISGTYYTASNFKVNYPNGGGGSSQIGDPGYASSVDLHASGGQLDNKGTSAGVTVDIDGDSRSSGSPDIGADEYSNNIQKDLALTTFLPGTSTCFGGKYNLQVRVTNVGTQTVNLTNDSVLFYAEITDPSFNYFSVGPIVLSNDTLAPGSSRLITLQTNFAMDQFGDYTILPFLIWPSDQNGSNDTLKGVVRDVTNPIAVIYAGSSPGICNGDSVKLSGANSDPVTAFQWYKDGVAITGAVDSIYYASTPGFYMVNVSAPNGCKKYTDSIQVIILNGPTGNMQASNTSVCQGDSASLWVNSNPAFTYQWKLNGNVITGSNDSILWAFTGGNYEVQVTDTVTGCRKTFSTNLTSGTAPNTTVTTPGNKTNFCQGDSLMLSAVSNSNYQYQWLLNGQSINGATQSDFYANATGSYQVRIQVVGGCSLGSQPLNITMDSLPNTFVNVTGGCGKDTVILAVSSVSGNSYQWFKDNNALSGKTQSILEVTLAGNYHIEITNAAGCKATSNAVPVSFKPAAATPIIYHPGSSSLCSGDSLRLSALSTDAAPLIYQWWKDNQAISGATDSFIYVSAAGQYQVKILNANNCEGVSASLTISVNPKPAPTVTLSGPITFCENDSLVITLDNAGTYSQIIWLRDGNAISGATGASLVIKTPGAYRVRVQNAAGCEEVSSITVVNVNPAPAPVISLNITTRELSSNIVSGNQWFLNGAPISGATSQNYIPTANGNYQVQVTGSNGCKGLSNVIVIGFVSTESVAHEQKISLFPNPAQQNVFLQFEGQPVLFRIYTPEGKVWKQGTIAPLQALDISMLPSGIYFIQAETQNGVKTLRFEKQ